MVKINDKIRLNLSEVAKRQNEANKWNELIDAIIDGRVIPVIGPGFLTDTEISGQLEMVNHHQQLIDVIASACDVNDHITSFSQLVHNRDFKSATNENRDIIYSLIAEVITQIKDQQQLKPGELLRKLLATKLFPFVITTSFSPIVEIAMQEVWPDTPIRILQYRNDAKRDLKYMIGDIESERDLTVPTVYYMFGKYSFEPHRYVVTDLDMMDFCKSWLAGGNKVPRVLYEALKKKYLLVLGNDYSDWLFRFIWYSIRDTPSLMKSSLVLQNNRAEHTLMEFLEQLQTFIEHDPNHMIMEIEQRVSERLKEKNKYNQVAAEYDVFLSYSRRDLNLVRKIRNSLFGLGLKVWFDEYDLSGGADWKNAIIKGINSTRLFIPILTHNIEREFMEPHEYRVEWLYAAEVARKMGGRVFIWPFAESGFDFYNEETKLPDEFLFKNASWFNIADDMTDLSKAVKSAVEKIKSKESSL